MKADYDIAHRGSRFRRQRRGVSTVGNSADYHFRSEADWLYSIEYARDLDRNDIVAGMIVDRLCDNILQDRGIEPDPQTGDENLDAALKDHWWRWGQDEEECDLAGEMTFQEIERTVLRSVIVDGDIMPLPNRSGALELMEAHRCRTPSNTNRNVVHGILLSDTRQRQEYWFTKDDIDPRLSFSRVGDTKRIAARNQDGQRQVFHVYDPNRFSQTRGVTAFRRVADALGMHDDIQFANLIRQQIAACFAIIRKRDIDWRGSGGQLYGESETETVGTATRLLAAVQPGMEVEGEPGEEITGFSPNIPNPEFFDHVMLILKLVSANLNLPLHAVLLDASQTNFSGWRGAIDQARVGFRRIQRVLWQKFHNRVYRWKVRQWIQSDTRLQTLAQQGDVKPFDVLWMCPKWDYIEPLKDITADIASIRGLQNSPRRVLGKRGLDIDDWRRETVEDNVKTIRACRVAARMLNQEAEDESEMVHWREVLALPVAEGLSITLNGGGDEPAPQPRDQEAAA